MTNYDHMLSLQTRLGISTSKMSLEPRNDISAVRLAARPPLEIEGPELVSVPRHNATVSLRLERLPERFLGGSPVGLLKIKLTIPLQRSKLHNDGEPRN